MVSEEALPRPASEEAKRLYKEANGLYEAGKFADAVEVYSQALLVEPSAAKPLYNRGLAYACMKNYGPALADFSKVIKICPRFPDAYYVRGLAYEYKRDNALALKDYNKALELRSNFSDARARVQKLGGTLTPAHFNPPAVTYAQGKPRDQGKIMVEQTAWLLVSLFFAVIPALYILYLAITSLGNLTLAIVYLCVVIIYLPAAASIIYILSERKKKGEI